MADDARTAEAALKGKNVMTQSFEATDDIIDVVKNKGKK